MKYDVIIMTAHGTEITGYSVEAADRTSANALVGRYAARFPAGTRWSVLEAGHAEREYRRNLQYGP